MASFDFNLEIASSKSDEKHVNFSKCLCHKDGNIGKLTPFTKISWETFRRAAKERDDSTYKLLNDVWDHGPKGVYHRQCYQAYTNSEHIARIKRHRTEETIDAPRNDPENGDPPTKKSMRHCSDYSKPRLCLICQTKKYDKSKKNLLPLSQCMTFQAGEKLLNAAKLCKDDRIIRELSHIDPIAAEISYHHSCYVGYTKKNLEETSCATKFDVYDETFDVLKKEVKESVIQNNKTTNMSNLIKRFNELLEVKGKDSPSYTTHKLKERLMKTFGDTLVFWKPKQKNESEIVFSAKVPTGQVVEAGCKLSEEATLNQLLEGNDEISASNSAFSDSQLYHAAKFLRMELKKVTSPLPNLPKADNLTAEALVLPEAVSKFLSWLITSDELQEEEMVKQPKNPEIQRHISSIGQDILYSISKGRVKTPKHIALAMAVKNLTGSSQVVSLLNRFGHSISYSELMNLESSLALEQTRRDQLGIIIPSNIKPDVFTTFCWDNNDLSEQTLSGSGTTHCTNGILIQRRVHTCEPPPHLLQTMTSNDVPSAFMPSTEQRRGPGNLKMKLTEQSIDNQAFCEASKRTMAWFLLRLSTKTGVLISDNSYDQQTVPGWSAFNALTQKEESIPSKSTVGYCQTIESSPTELSTVHTILRRSIMMANQLGQQDVMVVMDQAIYCKAKQIIWAHPEDYQRVILRMGAFHITCNFLGILGQRFGDAGLKDILAENEIIALGSLPTVLNGHHYNRAIRAHKIVFEALLRLKWTNFRSWLTQNQEMSVHYENLMALLKAINESNLKDQYQNLLDSPEFDMIFQAYDSYKSQEDGPMSVFWESYISLVQLLLNFIRSIREGNWSLHKTCLRKMLPWMFAYDHTNYSRYLTVYLWDMLQLDKTHPNAHIRMNDGEFVVQRSKNAFSQVPVDQTIEQTINRDSKTPGGIIGFSLNSSAMQRWILTSHERAAITQSCRSMAGLDNEGTRPHKEASRQRVANDEDCVKQVVSFLSDERNPFQASRDLVSISSGVVAEDTVKDDLLNAEEIGESALQEFMKSRLNSDVANFFDPLKKLSLGTFSNKSKQKGKKGKETTMKAEFDFYSRTLVIAQSRQLDLREVFTYELGNTPPSLASAEGGLCKNVKAHLGHQLEKKVENQPMLTHIPGSTFVIDGMSVLHTIKKVPATFGELAKQIFQIILGHASKLESVSRVDVVWDTYSITSIKFMEHNRRGAETSIQMKICQSSQKCPRQWQKFLSGSSNKEELIRFLHKEWQEDAYSVLLGERELYHTVGPDCYKLTSSLGVMQLELVESLHSSQEEADGRLLLHAKHASENGALTVVIESPDTDVEILCMYHQQYIQAKLLLIAGPRQKQRVVDITLLVDAWGEELCKCLVGLHAFTGTDSTSAFFGKGKKIAMSLLEDKEEARRAMRMLGQSFEVTDELFGLCEKFTAALYGKDEFGCIDEVRYALFCMKNQSSQYLPPTQDALKKHTMRANYQAAIWKRALDAEPDVPSPSGNGWTMSNGVLSIDWKEKEPAPKSLMEFLCCGCKTPCATRRCSCKAANLPCTDACRCPKTCQNRTGPAVPDPISDDDSDNDY